MNAKIWIRGLRCRRYISSALCILRLCRHSFHCVFASRQDLDGAASPANRQWRTRAQHWHRLWWMHEAHTGLQAFLAPLCLHACKSLVITAGNVSLHCFNGCSIMLHRARHGMPSFGRGLQSSHQQLSISGRTHLSLHCRKWQRLRPSTWLTQWIVFD